MDLKQRLAQLDKLTGKPVPAGVGARPESARSNGGEDELLGTLGLRRAETTAGPVWYRDTCDPIAPLAPRLPDLTGFLAREASARPAATDLLFLDTETTGLAGGTGTLVFLLGVSWWSGAELRTRQYFLPGPGHELALLTTLAEHADGFRAVLTFNGASFDLPLLRTRALLNRLPDPLAGLLSWDLLVPARRLWGHRLADCRQQTVESRVCGRERGPGDIDGARIPQTWFDFLATGAAGQLGHVLNHNQRDMAGMALIFARIWEHALELETGAAATAPPVGAEAGRAHCWALGRICERRQASEAAAMYFARAWVREWGLLSGPEVRRRFRRDAIRNLKRCRRWDLLEELIHDGLESDPRDAVLHREAAILYEHRLVDLDRALVHAQVVGDGHRAARLRRLGAIERDGDEPDS